MLACRPNLGKFFLTSGLVDELIEVDKKSGVGRTQALKYLKETEWDVIFCPHESPRTALWMRQLRAKRGKVGFHKWWNFAFFNKRVIKPMHLPDALRQLSLLAPMDARLAELFGSDEVEALGRPPDQSSPYDYRSPLIPEWARMQVKTHAREGKRIFLAPGSVWATKRWTETGFEELARLLSARGFAVEFVGSEQEREICERLAGRVKGATSSAGKTSLGQLVERFSKGTALVCNDSGAMHAAAAAGLPTVAVFGPTSLAQGFRPWQNQALVVQRQLECRPCGKHGADACPIKTHACMVEIRAVDVVGALDSLLGF